jgi:hypothetical protein
MSGFSPCVIFFQLFESPQRLKPESCWATFGTTEVVPFHFLPHDASFSSACKAVVRKLAVLPHPLWISFAEFKAPSQELGHRDIQKTTSYTEYSCLTRLLSIN